MKNLEKFENFGKLNEQEEDPYKEIFEPAKILGIKVDSLGWVNAPFGNGVLFKRSNKVIGFEGTLKGRTVDGWYNPRTKEFHINL